MRSRVVNRDVLERIESPAKISDACRVNHAHVPLGRTVAATLCALQDTRDVLRD